MSSIEDDVMVNTIKKAAKSTHSTPDPVSNKAPEPQTAFINSLHLTESCDQMEALKALIFNSPDTNQTKIEFIKEELLTGRYQIDNDQIAAKLTEYAPVATEPEIA